MSTVDNRVVKLQFDNAQFEQQVSRSMTTLDKLEEKLQFKKAASGIINLQANINSVGFEKLVKGIESIEQRLSATGIAAAKIVSEITQSLINGAKKIEQATIGQIKTGGWNRAMNIENAKFAIEGLEGDWDQLYKAMDYAVTGTAYGIDQAAKAAASLMASSVDYTKTIEKNGNTNVTMMHKTLRAISGVAAQTNADFDSIAHIFTTAAGNGRLMGEQLQQLANRGLNAASVLAKAYKVTEADIRELASKGKISFDMFAKAMDDAFGAHATAANKTFTGSLSNMKAALSRFGAVFATPIIQDTNVFFIALTDKLKEMKNAISDVTENGKVLEKRLEGHFADMWKNLIALSDTLIHSIDLSWFKRVANSLTTTTEGIAHLLDVMNQYAMMFTGATSNAKETLYNLATITQEEKDLAEKVIKGVFGNGAKRKAALEEEIKKAELNTSPDKIQAYVNEVSKYGYSFDKAGIKVKKFDEATEEATEDLSAIGSIMYGIQDIIKKFDWLMLDLSSISRKVSKAVNSAFGGIAGAVGLIVRVVDSFINTTRTIAKAFEMSNSVFKGLQHVFFGVKMIIDVLVKGYETLNAIIEYSVKGLIEYADENSIFLKTLSGIRSILIDVSEVLDVFIGIFIDAFSMFSQLGVDVIENATVIFGNFVDHINDITESLKDFKYILQPTQELLIVVADAISVMSIIIDGIVTGVMNLVQWIIEFAKYTIASWKEAGVFESVLSNLTVTVTNLYRIVKNLATTFTRVIKAIAIAFFRVFNPAKATGLLANFTGSLADLSDNFVLSEEGAEALADILTVVFTALDNVATTISTVITDIVSFVASLKKTDDALEDTGEESDRTTNKFQGILDILDKIHNFVTGAIDGFKELGNELKNNEGIKHLTDSLGKLKDSFKDSVGDGLNEFKDAVTDIADDTVAGVTIADIAEGIGKVADKLAEFIDKAPDIISKVENFFDTVWNSIKGFFEKFWNDKDVVGLKENISNIFNFGGQLAEDAKESVGDIFSKIKKAFSEINWKDVLDTGFVAGAVFFLYKITKFSDSVAHAFDSFGGILDSIVGIFKNIAGIFKSFGAALVNFSKAALLGTAVLGIVAIVGAIYVLSTIEQDDLDKALGALAYVLTCIIILVKLVSKIADAQAKAETAKKQAKQIKKSIAESIASVIQIVGAILAIGYVAKIMVDTTLKLAEAADTHDIGALVVAFGIIIVVVVVMGVLAFILAKGASKVAHRLSDAHTSLTKAFTEAKMLQAILIGVGALVAGFGVFLWGFSEAVKVLSDGGSMIEEAMGLTIALLIVILGGVALILYASKGVEAKSLFVIAGILLEMVIVLGLIFAGIYALSLVFIGLDSFQKENFVLMIEKATKLVIGIIAAVAALILSTAMAMAMAPKGQGLGKIFLGMIGMVAVIFAGMIWMTIELTKLQGTQTDAFLIAMGGVMVILLLLTDMMSYVVKLSKKVTDASVFDAITVMLVGLGAVVLMVALAITSIINSASNASIDSSNLGILISGFVIGMLIVVTLFNKIVQMLGKYSFKASAVEAMGLLMIEIAASFLIMAAGVSLISKCTENLSDNGLYAIISTLLLFTAVTGVVLGILSDFLKGIKGTNVTENRLKAVQLMGQVMLEVAAAMLIMSIGIAVIAETTKKISAATVGIIVGVFGVIIILVYMLGSLLKDAAKFKVNDKAVEAIKAIGLVILEIAAAALILAITARMMRDINSDDMLKLLGIMAMVVGGALILGVVVGLIPGIGKGLTTFAFALTAIAVAFLIFGAALVVISAGLDMAAPAITAFATAFGYFAMVLEQHQGVVVAVFVIIIGILIVAMYTIMKAVPIIDKIVTGITNGLQVIWDIMKKFGGKISGGVKNFFGNKKLSNTIKAGISTLLVAAASSLAESGPKVLQKIGDLLWLFIDWLIDITPKLIEKLIQIILDIIWGLLDAITAHMNEIIAAIQAIINTLGTLIIKAILDLVLGPLGSIAEKIGEAFHLNFLKNAGKGIKDFATEFGDQVVSVNEKTNKKLREEAKERDKAIQAWAEEPDAGDFNFEKYAKKLSSDQEKGNDILAKATDNSKETFEKYAETYNVDLEKEFLYGEKANETALEERKALISQAKAFTDAKGDFYKIYTKSTKLFEVEPNALSMFDYSYVKQAEKTGDSMLNTITKTFTNSEGIEVPIEAMPADMLMNGGYLEGTELGESLGIGATDEYQKYMSGTGMEDIVGSTKGVGTQAADTFTDDFSAGLVADSDQMEKAADNTVDATAAYLTDKENQKKMMASGNALSAKGSAGVRQEIWRWQESADLCIDGMRRSFDGFINGNMSDAKSLPAIAHSLCTTMQTELQAPYNFNMHSPSKTMMKIGGYIVDGLANGIYDNETGAISSMDSLSQSMLSSFMSPLDYVSRIASGEYQYDPSIRPVLDTTAIANGAYGINSMFNDQRISLNGLSGSIDTDIGRLDDTNVQIIAELKALRNDMTEMGDKIAGMQVVMDSGRLVGAIAPDMDRALGSRLSSSYRGKG